MWCLLLVETVQFCNIISHSTMRPYCLFTGDTVIILAPCYLIIIISYIIICNTRIDGLVQEGHNSIANALELRLSCTNPSIWWKFYSYTAVLYAVLHYNWPCHNENWLYSVVMLLLFLQHYCCNVYTILYHTISNLSTFSSQAYGAEDCGICDSSKSQLPIKATQAWHWQEQVVLTYYRACW